MKNTFIKVIVLFVVLFVCGCNSKRHEISSDIDPNLIFCLADSSKRTFDGELNSRKQLKVFLEDSSASSMQGEILIKNKQTLIQIAEPILFSLFGSESVISERPYEIYLFGDYWLMNGTMPRNMLGGTFSIAIDRRTCKVVGISHDK